MRVMDLHVYGVDLVSIIFQSAFAHDTQASPQASLCGGHQLQLKVIPGVLQSKVNSAHYIALVVNLVLLPFNINIENFYIRWTYR